MMGDDSARRPGRDTQRDAERLNFEAAMAGAKAAPVPFRVRLAYLHLRRLRDLCGGEADTVGDALRLLIETVTPLHVSGGSLDVERMDWRACPHVWIDAERVGGAVCFKGTRLPVGHLFENLLQGATLQQFIEWYPTDDPEQIPAAVLRWILDGLEAARDKSPNRSHAGPTREGER